MALTGALLASASVAKANAFMELISGGHIVEIHPGTAPGIYAAGYEGQTGNGAIFVGTVGTWTVDIASGGESGPFNVTLTDNINGGVTQTAGLEVIFSSGIYALGTPANPGHYNFGASDSGGNSLYAQVSGYYGSTLYSGSTLSTFESNSHLMGSWNLIPTFAESQQNLDFPISGSDYITEIMEFGDTTGSITPQQVTMNATASFTPYVAPPVVPDGGMTSTMVGSALLGLFALRSKFGAKRS